MKIARLKVQNYRTLEVLDLSLPSFYSAICGKNDSGKTNVVSVIETLLRQGRPPYFPYPLVERPEFSAKDDFTKWLEGDPKKRRLCVSIDLLIDQARDAGPYSFLKDYLSLESASAQLKLTINFEQTGGGDRQLTVETCGHTFDGLKAEEVLKRFRTSPTVLFHSSTELDERYGSSYRGALREISEEHSTRLEASQRAVNGVLRKIARNQEEKIESLLGRLGERYRVRLTCPTFDLSHFPYNITLGDMKVDVDLDDWGSGTRNRTLILLTIFRARQVADSNASASKITPVIIVEEPESFLHPSAQAEFGRVLQDLSEEFQVQIIVTTHSPYLLSHARPESNILLERKVVRRQPRQTERVDTSGDRWMEPFSLALGLSDEAFRPWRELLFSQPQQVLLVEGDIDKEYFELLRDELHGKDRLLLEGTIFPYGGRDALKNQALLRFIRERFQTVCVTFDLDSKDIVEKHLTDLGMRERVHYLPVGVNEAGKRKIEGLLPEAVLNAIHAEHPSLVAALSGTTEERRDAHRKLKKLYLERLKRDARPGAGSYGRLYDLSRAVNRAFSAQEKGANASAVEEGPPKARRRRSLQPVERTAT